MAMSSVLNGVIAVVSTTVAKGALGAAGGAVLASAAGLLTLKAVGLTAAGPAAGSSAAAWMSSAALANGGGIAAGSVYAAVQAEHRSCSGTALVRAAADGLHLRLHVEKVVVLEHPAPTLWRGLFSLLWARLSSFTLSCVLLLRPFPSFRIASSLLNFSLLESLLDHAGKRIVSKATMLRPPCHLHLPFFLLLLSLPPSLAAGGSAASNVDNVGFWLGFTLLVGLSSLDAAMSFLWTRLRMTFDGKDTYMLSCRVCGREVARAFLDPGVGDRIRKKGLSGGCWCHSVPSTNDVDGTTEVVLDLFGSLTVLPTLLIRRFNPSTSLLAPAGLVDNLCAFFKPGDYTGVQLLEHGVHLIVGLTDVSLGVAGLALNPRSPKALYTTVKDPKAPMTFENYSTLFLLYWLLGAVLTICMVPLCSKRLSVQIFAYPAGIAGGVASLASIVLFALGCWKIDVTRKAHEDWRPMLSYWIGGASVISYPFCGVEVSHTFGVVGLGFMLKHTFQS